MSERRALQIAIAVGSLVPILAGGGGLIFGPAMVGAAVFPTDADSHFRYLSGLLLGIGIAFATTIPSIESRTARFRLLASFVMLGGLGRLLSLVLRGYPGKSMLFGLAMELIATPALTVWQARVAAQARR